MSRPLAVLLVLVVAVAAVLGLLAALDREVPQTRVEKPVTHAPQP